MKQREKPNYVLKSYILENYQSDLKFENMMSYFYYVNDLIIDKRNYYHKIYGNDYNKINSKMQEFFNDNEKILKYINSDTYSKCKLFDKHYNDIVESDFIMNECHKINDATRKRTKRLETRITKMALSGNAIFLTLTFNDKVFEKMSDITRKRYIKQFLKENCIDYVANIDFGKKNEREHYHAVVIPKNTKIDNNNYYNYFYNSSINFERIRDTENYKAISKYVNKLTLHAIKETTRKNCVIYSRQ